MEIAKTAPPKYIQNVYCFLSIPYARVRKRLEQHRSSRVQTFSLQVQVKGLPPQNPQSIAKIITTHYLAIIETQSPLGGWSTRGLIAI